MIKSFTHANTGREVSIVVPLVYAVYSMPENKCTAILSSGGAIVPVKESVEDVKKKLKGEYAIQKKTK